MSEIFVLTEEQRLELQRINREYLDRIRHRLEHCQNPKLGLNNANDLRMAPNAKEKELRRNVSIGTKCARHRGDRRRVIN